MKSPFVLLALATLLFAFPANGQELKVILYPVEAIVDSATLKRDEFNERYPGIDITQYGLMDEGWYIRYTHELLVYVYGPIEDLDTARMQKNLLEEIRLSLVLKNPKLSTSTIELIEFKFEA